MISTPFRDRIWRFVEMEPMSGCWLWTGCRDKLGYGRTDRLGLGTSLAHRAMYLLCRGPVPTGLSLDHLCRNTSCVNPAHLEPVSQQTNCRRGARMARTENCIRGHDVSEMVRRADGKTNAGQRYCRRCMRERVAAAGYR